MHQEWHDIDGICWRVELSGDLLTLAAGDQVVALTRLQWPMDLYVSSNELRYVVRVDSADANIAFNLSHAEAGQLAPLLDALSSEPSVEVAAPARRQSEVTWPKVSRLALWALGCSSLCFVPFIGLLFTLVTIVLLVCHRRLVRRSDAFRHSRNLCTVAFVLMIVGMAVNLMATANLRHNVDKPQLTQSEVKLTHSPPQSIAASMSAGISSSLDRQINWGLVIAGLAVVLFSLSIHEAAHAISALWLGDDFARRSGRVTMNPLAHIEPFGTVILPLLLAIMGGVIFGWAKPVPVRTEVLDNPRRGHIWISLAGPASNLLLGAVSLMLLIGIGCVLAWAVPEATASQFATLGFEASVQFYGFSGAAFVAAICTILKISFVINIFLAFFNLIPIPPLDGSWVVENVFYRSLGPLYARIRPYGIWVFLIAISTGIIDYLLVPAFFVITPGQVMLDLCVPL